MKKVNATNTETTTEKKEVAVTPANATPKKKWTRTVKSYYFYSETKGFLMSNNTFGATGTRMVVDDVRKAHFIQEFILNTKMVDQLDILVKVD